MFDPVKRAWAVWVLANSSYGCKLNGSFGYDRKGGNSKKLDTKRTEFTATCADRLRHVQIECCDVGADQGHYDGYTQDDFDTLLETLGKLKGKFLLSSYQNDTLEACAERNGWYTLEFRMMNSMTNRYKVKNKIEVMTANYPITREMVQDLKGPETE
jgi:DNA adenine methylase